MAGYSYRVVINQKSAKKVVFLLLIIPLVFIAVLILVFSAKHTRPSGERKFDSLNKEELSHIAPGDIILRQGYGLASSLIASLIDNRYHFSHCGIIIQDQGQLFVIHALSKVLAPFDGVQIQPLAEFVKDSRPSSTMVVRYKWERERIPQLLLKAREYLESKIPFDLKFDLETKDAFYCTEFIWAVFRDVFAEEQDFFEVTLRENKKILNFNTFLNPAYFQIIVDHVGSVKK